MGVMDVFGDATWFVPSGEALYVDELGGTKGCGGCIGC